MVGDHDVVLNGKGKEGGLIADHARTKTTQKIVNGLLGSGVMVLIGGIGWLIDNAVHVAEAIAKIK
jgi:hypothetical protein